MVSPVFRPMPPVPATWAPAGGWYNAGVASATPVTASASSGSSPSPQQWDQYVNDIQQALQASSGFERVKLQRQYEDAEAGRQNAYKIAKLQSDTSRYGTDASREVQLAQLKESQRQFDARHGLEMAQFEESKRQFEKNFGLSEAGVTGTYNGQPTEAARQFNANLGQRQYEYGTDYGLRRAQAIAQYSSTPDQMFMRSDLMNALNNAEAGQGPSPYGAVGSPVAKTPADFDAISGPPGRIGQGGNNGQSGYVLRGGGGEPMFHTNGGGFSEGPMSGGGAAVSQQEGPQWQDYAALQGFGSLPAVQNRRPMAGVPGAAAAAPAAGAADPRIKAVRAIADALPPSDGEGMDHNDWAAIQSIQGLFKARRPGFYARLRPGQQLAAQGALARGGAYVPDVLEDYDRSLPRQGSVRRA